MQALCGVRSSRDRACFEDAEGDQVGEKHYVFYQDVCRGVTGKVDAYEPESVWLFVRCRACSQADLDDILERARYQVVRLNGRHLQDDSMT